jgi:hypothetical protein
MPSARRAANKTAKENARPPTTIAALHNTMLAASRRTRDIRSVSAPTGMVARPPTTPKAAARTPISVLDTWNACLMFGASTPRAERSALSRARTMARTTAKLRP